MGAGRGGAAAGGDATASGRRRAFAFAFAFAFPFDPPSGNPFEPPDPFASPRDPFDPARGPPRDDPPGLDPAKKKRDAPGDGDGDEDDAPKVPATRSLSDRGDELGAGDSGGRECACAE
jgi:hypothetical protein